MLYEYFETAGGVDVCNGNLAYDDACHLKRFIMRRKENTNLDAIRQLNLVVDKMHFKNHVDKWCKKNVNPFSNSIFNGINTQVCEQTFSWLCKYKHSLSNMRKSRFQMVIISVCHLRNELFYRHRK